MYFKRYQKDLRNICQDYAVFSEAAYEAIYESGSLVKIKHVPKNQVLPNKMTPEGDIEGYWFSLDFNQPKKSNVSLANTQMSCLVPNVRGMEEALKSGIQDVAIFGACSETFSQKNINCSIAESFIRFREVMEMAKFHNIKVRGYLSTAFGCLS